MTCGLLIQSISISNKYERLMESKATGPTLTGLFISAAETQETKENRGRLLTR